MTTASADAMSTKLVEHAMVRGDSASATPSINLEKLESRRDAHEGGTPIARRVLRGSIVGVAAFGSMLAGTTAATGAAGETGTVSNRSALSQKHSQALPAQPSTRAMRSADELKDWLSLSDAELAKACGFSRRTLLNWRKGTSAYGVSSRRLFALHALVGNLRAVLGPERALTWLNGSFGDVSRLEAVATGDPRRLREVTDEAAAILFETPRPARDFDSGLTQNEEAALVLGAQPARQIASSPPVRARRI